MSFCLSPNPYCGLRHPSPLPLDFPAIPCSVPPLPPTHGSCFFKMVFTCFFSQNPLTVSFLVFCSLRVDKKKVPHLRFRVAPSDTCKRLSQFFFEPVSPASHFCPHLTCDLSFCFFSLTSGTPLEPGERPFPKWSPYFVLARTLRAGPFVPPTLLSWACRLPLGLATGEEPSFLSTFRISSGFCFFSF